MEAQTQRETRRRGLRGAGPMGPTPVRRRSARHHVEVPEKPADVVFNPSDPYSAAMDDMPLKALFPNMKVRKRSQGKKVEATEAPSPKNTESDESVRSKLRDSLAAALTKIDSAEWEQDRGQDFKAETEREEQLENMDLKTEEGDKKMAKDQEMADLEVVILEEKAGADLQDNVNKLDSMSGDCKLVKEEDVDSADIDEAPSKRIKLEVENIKVADSSNQNEASELAERVAFDIEAELYKQFGGVNRKYKEKARSLLFNLKDRSNPELRSRVLAGEITPENLCSMNAEQLASKELSEWRIAKAEEFAHMVVLTEADAEQPRLVKKTHKGEIEVEVEKDDVLTEVVTAGSQPRFTLATQQETEEAGANALPTPTIADDEIDNGNDTEVVEADAEGLEFSPIRELNLTVGISAAADHVPDVMMLEVGEEVQEEENASLPAILSLDEFVGSKKLKEPKVPVKGDELELKLGLNEVKPPASASQSDSAIAPPTTIVKDKAARKSVASPNRKHVDLGNSKIGAISQKERKKEHKLNEKLWEGSFQLSGSQISPVLALFKSGDGVELQSWPKLIEIKGRVRLDALEKFLQELRLSRTRAVMIIACRVGEGEAERGASVNAMKEAANQYQRGERVGYAEPVPGYELYLFPGAGSSLKLLVEHGYLNTDQTSAEEEGILIGFVVCRRSTAPTNASHKSSSHYFNANRHALSAQLDSPTRPNEIQWTGNVVATSKTPSFLLPSSKESENYSASLSFINLQGGSSVANSSAEGGMLTSAGRGKSNSLRHNPAEPDSLFQQGPQDLRSGKVKPDWLRKDVVKDEDADDDLPPGFGPKALTMPKRSILDDDDDDLPEYDFSSQNSAPIFTSIKAPDIGQLPPFNMQASYAQGSIFPPLPQGSLGGLSQPETAIPFEQLNPSGQHPSQFPRPPGSHIGGPLEQVRSLAPSSTQVSQPLHFQAGGPHPPPGPPPGPPPYGIFPPRPHMTTDGSFAMRMPSAAQMPALNVLHAEQKEAFTGSFNQPPQNRPSTPQVYDDQRTRATIPLLQSHPAPVSQTPTGPGQRRGGSQGSSLWDDDDMPEWCPPALAQQSENRQIPPRPPVVPSVESGPASVPPRGMTPLMGGSWQGMPLPPAVPVQGEGRGILQAPPTAMRYPGSPSGGHFPIARPEKFSTDRGPSIRPNETRGFKGGK